MPGHLKTTVGLALAAALLLARMHCALAADITVDLRSGFANVIITGELLPGDGQAFADKVDGVSNAVVLFGSPGGNLLAGLRIGTIIRLKQFATAVPDGVGCASACAIAWLGGSVRYMGRTAMIGFHAAYAVRNGHPTESGVANALVGAYVSRLGLSDAAIVYITSAPPDDIRWLSEEDAGRHGIEVARLPVLPTDGPSPPLAAPDTEPALPPLRLPAAPRQAAPRLSLDQVARAFVDAYFAHWSENNAAALGYFERAYAETINFYGKPIARKTLMEEKRRYAERWPERVYTARAGSLAADCDEHSGRCTVTGQVEWDCRSLERGAKSTGLANFTLQISAAAPGEAQILGEWGSVVTRQ